MNRPWLRESREEKRFYPFGSDQQVSSDFPVDCRHGARPAPAGGGERPRRPVRVLIWTFELPGLRQRGKILSKP